MTRFKGSRWARRQSRRPGNPAVTPWRVRPYRRLVEGYVFYKKGGPDKRIDAETWAGNRSAMARFYRSGRHVKVQTNLFDHPWGHGWHKASMKHWRPRQYVRNTNWGW